MWCRIMIGALGGFIVLRHTHVRRSLALAAVVAATTWSTGALPATADPVHGQRGTGWPGDRPPTEHQAKSGSGHETNKGRRQT